MATCLSFEMCRRAIKSVCGGGRNLGESKAQIRRSVPAGAQLDVSQLHPWLSVPAAHLLCLLCGMGGPRVSTQGPFPTPTSAARAVPHPPLRPCPTHMFAARNGRTARALPPPPLRPQGPFPTPRTASQGGCLPPSSKAQGSQSSFSSPLGRRAVVDKCPSWWTKVRGGQMPVAVDKCPLASAKQKDKGGRLLQRTCVLIVGQASVGYICLNLKAPM